MSEGYGYVGECPQCHGAIIVTAITDDRKFAAKHVAEMVERGYTVKRRTIEEIRASKFGHGAGCMFEADKDPQLTLPTRSA